MFSAFEWMMAIRYLRARRKEGFVSVIAWFSLLGIAIGVATLIIVMSVMNGFRAELMNRILGLNGHVNVYSTVGTMTDFQTKADIVLKVPGVVSASPLIEGQVMATHNGQARGAVMRGIKSDDLRRRKILSSNIKSGSLDDFGADDSIIIGTEMARRLGARVGDKITIISPKGQATAFGTVPRMRAFRIAATFSIGMFEYDSGFAFIPLHAAQVYFQMPDTVSNLEVFVQDPHKTVEVGLAIKKALNNKARVYDWQKTNASFFNAIQVERNVMFLILTLIIVVAAFNIISSLIMLVKDKGRDIAILRTMGATRGMIMRIFFIAGASIGVFGTLGGFGLGLWFSLNIENIRQWIQSITGTELFAAEIYFLSQLPAKVDPMEVLATVLMGLGLSFLATLYPSWRAARLDPAEALRYE